MLRLIEKNIELNKLFVKFGIDYLKGMSSLFKNTTDYLVYSSREIIKKKDDVKKSYKASEIFKLLDKE